MSGQERAAQIDARHPHPARVYDFWLGGKDNFAADRDAAQEAIAANPGIVDDARACRAFLGRSVRYLAAECGISQFLDIGSGLPTSRNTHEVAQAAQPGARVVYVDNDPVVLTHSRAMLVSGPDGRCDFLDADLREPDAIVAGAARTLDFQPAGRPAAADGPAFHPGPGQPGGDRRRPAAGAPRPAVTWCSAIRPAMSGPPRSAR